MPMKKRRPVSPGQRHGVLPEYSELTRKKPEKSLLRKQKRRSARNAQGRITVRHRGGGAKRRYRLVDFRRDKWDVPAKVVSQEYDPNRSSWIVLLQYADGEKRYILSPFEAKIGDVVRAGSGVDPKPGNAMPLRRVPVGATVHNVELTPGSGGKIARAAGTEVKVLSKEGKRATLRLPSGEMRQFHLDCMATIGSVSNPDHKNIQHGKAGRRRHLGFRPAVRGTAMAPADHPHGGGEGRTGEGRAPKSPWGWLAKGGRKTRRRRKPSDAWIVKRRQ